MMNAVQAIIDALRRAPAIVVPLVREVPADVLKRRPSPGRWSAHEHACHLSHVHALFFDRLEYMLKDPAPVIKPYLPGEQDSDDFLLRMDLDACLDRFVLDREGLVARLEALSPADWRRTAKHGEYRRYSVFIMFRHLALHDFLHAYRIEELLLRPDWPASSDALSGTSRSDRKSRSISMAENKTRPTGASVQDYIETRANGQQRADCRELMLLFKKVTGHSAKMWGPSIVGYGSYRYTYESGRTGEAPLAGFAIRGREIVVYVSTEGEEQRSLLSRIGKHRMGKYCLYFRQLGDLDRSVLEKLVAGSIAEVKRRYE